VTAHTYKEFRGHVVYAVREFLRGNQYEIKALGVAVAGEVERGKVVSSQELPYLIDRPLEPSLAKAFGVPVKLMELCTATALGEFTRLSRPLIYVDWGKTVDVTLIQSERSIVPTRLGHLLISTSADALTCGEHCSGRGHLEGYVSIPGIETQYQRKLAEVPPGAWQSILRTMALGVQNISLLSPRLLIVIGGQVASEQLGQEGIEKLEDILARLGFSRLASQISLAQGRDATLDGCIAAARQLVS
jgi:predicted NBD/HSP70 family sugar kinase